MSEISIQSIFKYEKNNNIEKLYIHQEILNIPRYQTPFAYQTIDVSLLTHAVSLENAFYLDTFKRRELVITIGDTYFMEKFRWLEYKERDKLCFINKII